MGQRYNFTHRMSHNEWLTLQYQRMVHCAVSTPELLPTLCYDPSQGRHLIWELKRNKINSLCLWLDGAGDGSPWYLPGSVPVCSLGHTLRIITHTSDTTFQLQIPRTHNRVYIADCRLHIISHFYIHCRPVQFSINNQFTCGGGIAGHQARPPAAPPLRWMAGSGRVSQLPAFRHVCTGTWWHAYYLAPQYHSGNQD